MHAKNTHYSLSIFFYDWTNWSNVYALHVCSKNNIEASESLGFKLYVNRSNINKYFNTLIFEAEAKQILFHFQIEAFEIFVSYIWSHIQSSSFSKKSICNTCNDIRTCNEEELSRVSNNNREIKKERCPFFSVATASLGFLRLRLREMHICGK